MLAKVIEFIRKLFERNPASRLPYSDEYYDKVIAEKEKRLEMFHEVVGDSPMDHIDWIIENGFEEFNSKQIEIEEQAKIEFKVGDLVTMDEQLIEYSDYEDDEDDVAEEAYESIDLDEIVICKSIVQGRLRFYSAMSGNSFEWQEYGDIQSMTRREYKEMFEDSDLVEIIDPRVGAWGDIEMREYRLGGLPVNKLKHSDKIVSLDDWKSSSTRRTERVLAMEAGFLPGSKEEKEIRLDHIW